MKPTADAQQPNWPDPIAVDTVTRTLSALPPLVLAGECDQLRARLAAVSRGEAFLLQGGDCAETFDALSLETVAAQVRTLRQMAVMLSYGGSKPVVTVARLAGQYAKPRSSPTETRDGTTLPAYRGDAVNGLPFTAAARTPDPRRLLRTYHASAATLNLARALTADGVAPGELFVSHEGLLLDYETPLTRLDARTRARYATSGHLLWIGERTRDPDGPHVRFLAGVRNPIAVKLGPGTTPAVLLELIRRLDPDREPGRLTLIARMGADRIREVLPGLVETAREAHAPVVWVSDPMHGNTFVTPSGHKTRDFGQIVTELRSFFEIHRALGTHPGGVHVELTGDDVTECVGGGAGIGPADLDRRYRSACDPRLNGSQALELGLLVAELLADRRSRLFASSARAVMPSLS